MQTNTLSSLVVTATLAVSGCATLEVAKLPLETAMSASQSEFWNEISDARSGNWFHLLNAGEEALEWRIRMIDSASASIDMETFLWKPDASGLKILNHLLAAADRGVRVRILLDDSFTVHEELALHAIDAHQNIELRLYNPFLHRSDSVVWRELFNLGEFARINHRMHNKAMVVDGRAALVGGRNLADEYFGLEERFNFRDMEVINVGPAVPSISEHFDGFWNSGWAFPIADVLEIGNAASDLADQRSKLSANAPLTGLPDSVELAAQWRSMAEVAFVGQASFVFDHPATRNPAEPDEMPDQLARVLQNLIASAQTDVTLVSAYLVPTPEFEVAVEQAEARGVSVRVLTNSLRSNNHIAAHAAYRGHLGRLIVHGADLHEVRVNAADRGLYMRAPIDDKRLGLHAKLLLIDDAISFIGSANLDPRSLKINTEVGLVVESETLNRALRSQLSIDFETRNAWVVRLSASGEPLWMGDNEVLAQQPADSGIQLLEDWFIGLLPIDSQM